MGLLDQKTSHIPDLVTVKRGEYQIQIVEARETEYSTGRLGVALTFEIIDYPNAGYVYHNVTSPMEGDNKRQTEGILRNMRAFKQAFGFGADDPVDTESLVGLTGFAIIDEEDRDTGKRNVIRSFSVSQAG